MAVKFKDYYETLGLPRTATADEIKAAFRKLARVYHPDVAKNKATAETKFKEINEANEVLSDPEKRKRYDELGPNWEGTAPPPPAGYASNGNGQGPGADESFEFGGTGFSDFFESFFGGGRQGFGPSRRGAARGESSPSRGADVEADILVTLEEVLRGSSRKVTLRRPATATEAERTNSYQVRIKPGARDGQLIRLAGQGAAGHGGAAPGDLFLRVRLAQHPDFTVQGSDLYYDLDLAPWEAVLGVQTNIPALDGATSLRVPAGTAAGSRLRLRGLGLPNESGQRGDLYANLQVQVPATVSSDERALWEKLASTSTFHPRNRS